MKTTWDKAEIEAIGSTDDLHVAPFREDGKTYGTLTWIWSVVVDGELYVRAYHGTASRWHKAAMKQGVERFGNLFGGESHGKGGVASISHRHLDPGNGFPQFVDQKAMIQRADLTLFDHGLNRVK